MAPDFRAAGASPVQRLPRPRVVALTLAAILTAGDAGADQIDTEGMEPWETCALCHSLDGVSRMARFPKLAGQKPAYILKQVRDIRHGSRTNDGGQMQAVVTEVADEDLAAIADWFASQAAPPPEPEPEGDAAAGASLFEERGCASCHSGDAPDGLTPPHIAAQHEAYIAKQLTDFREGRRENDPLGVMREQASNLSDEEISALAAHLAATARNGTDP